MNPKQITVHVDITTIEPIRRVIVAGAMWEDARAHVGQLRREIHDGDGRPGGLTAPVLESDHDAYGAARARLLRAELELSEAHRALHVFVTTAA